MRFHYLRTKFGCEIRVTIDTAGCYHVSANGSLRTVYTAAEYPGDALAFWRAWSAETGHKPMTILAKRRGRFVKAAESFIPAGRELAKIKGRNGRYTISTKPAI